MSVSALEGRSEAESGRAEAIRIDRLSKSYGEVTAIRGLSLRISAGSLVGLIGPNGAGKSTLIGCLGGLVEPSEGRICLLGKSFQEHSVELKRRIGVMPEDLALFDELQGEEFLRFVAGIYGLDRETMNLRVDDLFQALDLEEARGRLIGGFSAGMRKKLAFAAAVIHRPDLLLLDEPFAHIDPGGVAMLKACLRDFTSRGGTVLLTSHGLETVERFCEEIAIFHQGEILWRGSPSRMGREWRVTIGDRAFATLEELYLYLIGSSDRRLAWL